MDRDSDMATWPQLPASTAQKIRVLVVDDSVVMRRLISTALEGEPGIEVAGTAASGSIALQRIPQLSPDLVTLDIEMPEMDGVETLRRIRRCYPALRVVMCSTLTERGAAITMEALASGASDYVAKRGNQGGFADRTSPFRQELVAKIKQFTAPCAAGTERVPSRLLAPVFSAPRLAPVRSERQIVAIGVSTGGPSALAELISALPASFDLPIVVVQHMPPLFTRLLAERLNSHSALPVREAADGCRVEKGHVYIAPGDHHMIVAPGPGGMQIKLHQGLPENSCRPAVDVLFRSVAEAYGAGSVSVVLTGMGQDGLRGVRILKERGAFVLAQDEASSVVWGMPGFVARAGLADKVVALRNVVPEILLEIASSKAQAKSNGSLR